MTEPFNDNIPTVDKIVYIEQDDPAQTSDIDNDDDLHVCRKCNKVFKNLPEYLEHKVKYENFRISQTRSKLDRRMLLPQLVQKQKKKTRRDNVGDALKSEDLVHTETESVNSSELKPCSANSCEVNVGTSLVKEEVELKEQDNLIPPQTVKKRGRKRKSFVLEVPTSQSGLEVAYLCTVCEKKFRREATLRWHMKYEHKSNEENDEDSENELTREVQAENDGDFTAKTEKEESDDHHFKGDEGRSPQEIHIIIEQPENGSKLHRTEEAEGGETAEQTTKQPPVKHSNEAGVKDSDRPYTCDICGHTFKELTVLKAHGVVHSDERKFVCTAENCPYGFKTKGGLVRHMRRHTGERPYSCENCGRSFSESGALTRHMKSRRNCAQTPDSAYPRYMKNWTYHPNIPAVINPSQRDAQQGRSTIRQPVMVAQAEAAEEIHYLITESADSDIITAEIIAPQGSSVAAIGSAAGINPQLMEETKQTLEIKLEQADIAEAEEWNTNIGEIHNSADIITTTSTEIVDEASKTLYSRLEQQQADTATVSQNVIDSSIVSTHQQPAADLAQDADCINLKSSKEVQFHKSTQCHVCKKDVGNVEGLEIHLRSHLADHSTRCDLCHFLSHDREELRQHILSMHHDSLNNAEASVLSMEELEEQVNSETSKNRKSSSRDALIAVKQLYSLKKQKTETEGEKSCPSAVGCIQCIVCSRFFRGINYLRQHMRTHTGDRPHQCHVCYRSFTSRDILKKHMYVHKEQRDFKCGECGKLFKRLAHVQQHLRIHSQERLFRCAVCEKLFKSQNSLTVHMRTHSGVNPYKCHVCNKHFRERGSLHRHMRLHTGEKPYKCSHCNRAFAEHGTLSRHLKAKVPCSSNRSTFNLDHSSTSSSTMLSQFSTMVANTQQYITTGDCDKQYIQHGEAGQQFMLPSVQEVAEDGVILDAMVKGADDVIENVEVITEKALAPLAKTDGEFDSQETETETLHIFDSDTGESVIIVAEKSIVDLIREQQLSFESGDAESSWNKVKDILNAVGNVTSTVKEFSVISEQDEVACTEDNKETSSQEETLMPENAD